MSPFSHFHEDGRSRMVNVSEKPITLRRAKAESFVTMQPATAGLIREQAIAKGNVLEVARLAGIMAAKKTGDLIPLCHPLGIDGVDLSLEFVDGGRLRLEASVLVHGRTGVEMEALTAVTVAGLTVYDMCKSVDKQMTLGPTRLLEKSGGRSGAFRAEPAAS